VESRVNGASAWYTYYVSDQILRFDRCFHVTQYKIQNVERQMSYKLSNPTITNYITSLDSNSQTNTAEPLRHLHLIYAGALI
jgi:hypothetical protein